MKKNLVRFAVAGLAGVTILTFNTLSMTAAGIANEQSLAGITLSLNQYYESLLGEDQTTAVARTASSDTTGEGSSMTATNDQETANPTSINSHIPEPAAEHEAEPVPTPEPTPEPKTIQEQIVNMNFDRLGIAKVDSYLNIREEPKDDGKIIGKLPKDAGCHIYEIDDKGWAKIVSGKITGYVSSEYMITDKEAEEYALTVGSEVAVVNTDALNVRFVPSTDSAMYTQIQIDEDLEIVKQDLDTEFVEKFIAEHFKGDKSALIAEVDQDAMMAQLENWMCVAIDNEKVFVAKEFVDIAYKLKKASPFEVVKEDQTSGVTSVRAQMVDYAMQFLGHPYVYGGTSLTNGIDCSAFMMRIYQKFGYSIPRNSSAQAAASRGINYSDIKPGDLIFYGSSGGVSHVAMYIGGGQVIHASTAKTGIKISNATYRKPLKIGRFL